MHNSSQRMSVTFDEVNHYFCGLEWLQEGTYAAWPENPALSRVIPAMGPYLKGYRAKGFTLEGNNLGMWDHFFNSYRMDYLHETSLGNPLALIRYGILPVFLLSIFLVWLWTRRLCGDYGAMIAAGMYSFTPLILGHSGLATTDITFVCAFTFLIWTFFRWINKATLMNGVWFGLGLAIALLTKYTVLPFFGITMVVTFALKWSKDKSINYFPISNWLKGWLPSGFLATVIMIISVWAFHGFHVGAIGNEPVIKTMIAEGAFSSVYNNIVVPAPEWFAGILLLLDHNDAGHVSYMFGELSTTGFWYFYPVGLTIKTPIPALLFGLLAFVGLVKSRKELDWEILATFLIPFALMISVMTSHINIGTRHIRGVYPLFCIGAVATLMYYLKNKKLGKFAVLQYLPIVLLAWQIIIAINAYPNYTNYFNVLAGKEPGKIIADSDLGWGQGLIELSNYSKANNIDTLNLSYFGIADECLYDLPKIVHLPINQEVKGWVAISENNYWGIFTHLNNTSDTTACRKLGIEFLDQSTPHSYFRWLDNYKPITKIAGSIRIYYIE